MFPENITKLHFAIFSFKTVITQNCAMPAYKGSVLRGAFGHSFRKTVCTMPAQKDCINCLLKNSCPHSYIFESHHSNKARILRKYPSVPQPFILEPPEDSKTFYEKGDSFDFNLILIGKAIDYIPYFVYAFKEAGKAGMGPGREGKFSLWKVVNYNFLLSRSSVVYNGKGGAVNIPDYIIRVANVNEIVENWEEIPEVSLDFLTPIRIRYREKLVNYLDFHIFMRSFLRRLSSIFYFHCGEELFLDYRGLVERAKFIDKVSSNLHWKDLNCYSSRQKAEIKLGGFMGDVTYRGDLKAFIVFILLGKYFHLGKGISYGLGRYEVNL